MTTPSKQKVTVGMLLFWRTLITAGVAAILWLQSTFVSKESFKQWETGHDVLRDNIMKNIDGRFDSVQIQLNRIENKIERLPSPRRVELQSRPSVFMGTVSTNVKSNLND